MKIAESRAFFAESIIPCHSERSICVAKNLYFIFEIFRFAQYDKKGQILRIAESRLDCATHFTESSFAESRGKNYGI